MIFKLLIDQKLEIAIIIFHDFYKNSEYKLKLKIKQPIFYKTKKEAEASSCLQTQSDIEMSITKAFHEIVKITRPPRHIIVTLPRASSNNNLV